MSNEAVTVVLLAFFGLSWQLHGVSRQVQDLRDRVDHLLAPDFDSDDPSDP